MDMDDMLKEGLNSSFGLVFSREQTNKRQDQMGLVENRVCMGLHGYAVQISAEHVIQNFIKFAGTSGLCASNCSAQHIHAMDLQTRFGTLSMSME